MQQDGWRNEWVHRRRIIKELEVKCRMNCRMTMDAFQLSVDVIRGKEVLLSKLIVTTKPHEILFHRKVDTVDFFEDRIRVWGKHDTLLGEILLPEIPL